MFDKSPQGNVRIELYSDPMGKATILEPINWDDAEREYARHKEFMGVFSKISNHFIFIGSGYTYLKNLYKDYGIEPDVVLSKFQKNENELDERWQLRERGFINLSTWEDNEDEKQGKAKFDESTFFQQINSRKNEEYDLTSLVTSDGAALSPLTTEILQINEGRQILRRSRLTIEEDVEQTVSETPSGTDARAFEFRIDYSSDERINNITAPYVQLTGSGYADTSPVGAQFYLNADQNRSLHITGLLDFRYISGNEVDNVRIDIVIYENGDSMDRKEVINLFNLSTDGYTDAGLQRITLPIDQLVNLLEGDSVTLSVRTTMVIPPGSLPPYPDAVIQYYAGNQLLIVEDSVFQSSSSKILLPYEKFERLVAMITNKTMRFRSNYFGRTDLGYATDGEGAFLACANGFWARGFPDLVNEGTDEQRRTQYKTSLNDAIQSHNAIKPICVFVERYNGKEVLRVEPLEYVFQKFVGIIVGETENGQFKTITVNKLNRKVYEEYYFNSVSVGYEKGAGDYEEVYGLDECNGKLEFITCITKLQKKYEVLSKYRADSYGFEFARRKPYTTNPNEDTKYDEDIFFLHVRRAGSVFALRRWDDDFEELPTGIYSPETAFNLEITPKRNLVRHGWIIRAGLVKYPDAYLRFISSNCNSQLSTKKVDADYVVEDEAILNSDLGRPRFLPEEITFEAPIDYEMRLQIEGFTQVGGELVSNLYGMIKIQTQNGYEYVYAQSIKQSKEGQWTALKAFL